MLAYERALELAPGDGFVLERLEHLGALLRIEGPDGEVFWLTPGDFERVMRHELASASNDPDQLVLLGDRLLGGGHVALAASAAELALAGSEDLPGAWALAGLTRAALGRELQAREALGRAAALDPSNVAVARALVQREDDPEGDLPRAHAEVQRRPGSAAAWIVLGRLPGRRRSAERGARRLRARARPRSGAARAPSMRARPCACSADHLRRYAPVLGDPKRSITFGQAPGAAHDAAPHPGRQMMRVDLAGGDHSSCLAGPRRARA